MDSWFWLLLDENVDERGEEVKYICKGWGSIKLDHGQLGFEGNEDSREMADSKKVREANGL